VALIRLTLKSTDTGSMYVKQGGRKLLYRSGIIIPVIPIIPLIPVIPIIPLDFCYRDLEIAN
jgi:hypothetical protein